MRKQFLLTCLGLLLSTTAFAAEDLVAERRAVLEKIVRHLETRYASGTADTAEIGRAKLDLCAFERDAAKETEQRAIWQQKIVKLLTDQLANVEGRRAAGLGDELEILRAKDRLLAARCELASLQKPKN